MTDPAAHEERAAIIRSGEALPKSEPTAIVPLGGENGRERAFDILRAEAQRIFDAHYAGKDPIEAMPDLWVALARLLEDAPEHEKDR